jgi:sugar lactone lactonase YvrE
VRAYYIQVALLLATVSLLGQETNKTHGDFRAEAAAAYQRKDFAKAKSAAEAALALRPDSPHYLHNLAAVCALMGDASSGFKYLHQLAALGVATNIERDPDLASLQGAPEFRRILQVFAANRAPQGEAETLMELPGRNGIIDGIAYRERTGDLFLGDVHHRCIWRRGRDARVVRFTAEDEELLGIFGIAIDEPRNTLWAAMSAVPEMSDYASDMKGHAALAEFNLATSELRRVIPVPDDGSEHSLTDLVVGPDGSVYTTDSKASAIWFLAPDDEELQKAVESPLFISLQGVTIENRTLVVADHANGLFSVDLATRNITALVPPKNVTLLAIDGLVTVAGGIVATQNGVEPQRVIRVGLSPELNAITGVTVLAAGLPNLTDLALVTRMNDRPTLVAGAGWDGFDPVKHPHPAVHTVHIFQVALP